MDEEIFVPKVGKQNETAMKYTISHPHSHSHLLQHSHSKTVVIITQARVVVDKPPLFPVTSTEPAQVKAVVTYASENLLLIDSFWLSTDTNAEGMHVVVGGYTSADALSDIRQLRQLIYLRQLI